MSNLIITPQTDFEKLEYQEEPFPVTIQYYETYQESLDDRLYEVHEDEDSELAYSFRCPTRSSFIQLLRDTMDFTANVLIKDDLEPGDDSTDEIMEALSFIDLLSSYLSETR